MKTKKKSEEKVFKAYQELQTLFSEFFYCVSHQDFEKAFCVRKQIIGILMRHEKK